MNVDVHDTWVRGGLLREMAIKRYFFICDLEVQGCLRSVVQISGVLLFRRWNDS